MKNLYSEIYQFSIDYLKNENIKKLNKENITFNDIKLLHILNV